MRKKVVRWRGFMNYLFIADKDYGNMKNSIQNTYNLNVTTDQCTGKTFSRCHYSDLERLVSKA